MADRVNSKVTRDWSKYNAALVNRGYLTIFVSKDFAREWYMNYDANTPRKRGGQPKYTEESITTLLSLRFVFKQPLSSIEGSVAKLNFQHTKIFVLCKI